MATGTRAAKMTSDLDLVWLPEHSINKNEASSLLKELNQFGIHADLQVIQGNNGFSLEEYANSTSTIMMKTLEDPILVKDPWLK
ncbi:phosphoribosyl-dephospho-CoA transferase MdcG domain-containing protein [Companilactobacillus paralimentarius]|uniref:phosphoribosyl-dephospho-CoA transferase MdcG domain-containing protein n=1 Tax=Companilactobacillus paralimentarius TaxID=83526 RepID=UPI00221EDFBE|nr:phosphoribosyl-dephospho-CoA transferase MdcG domain-containing protein [Companilactobacillus paralimentarius]